MGWTTTDSLDAFRAAAWPFLERRPVEHSLPRTICGTLGRRGAGAYGQEPPRFGWWSPAEGGEVEAAYLQTPPYPPLLTRGTPQASRELAAVLDGPLSGMRGEGEAVRAFGEAWGRRTGAGVRVVQEMRLYRLGTLTPVEPGPPGAARVAGEADRDLLEGWHAEFARDVDEEPAQVVRTLDDALPYGGRTLWEVDGEPVAMAGSTAPEDGAVRIVAVYTPAALRGRGYAGAVTAAVARAARDRGARDVLLFADLANPVSNRLYQRLGFEPAGDHVTLAFIPGPVS